jgi:hypothetical protein
MPNSRVSRAGEDPVRYPDNTLAMRQRCEMTRHCEPIRPSGKICSIF